jgi:hypothetical protein
MSVLNDAAMGWLNAGLGLLYPEVCQLCGRTRATPAEGYVCGSCRAQARFIRQPFCERCGRPYEGDITTQFECANCREMEWHFQSARSAVAARDPVLEAIHRYKYIKAEGLRLVFCGNHPFSQIFPISAPSSPCPTSKPLGEITTTPGVHLRA